MEDLLLFEERAVTLLAEITMGWMKAHERHKRRSRRINFQAPFWQILKIVSGAVAVWLVFVMAGAFYPG